MACDLCGKTGVYLEDLRDQYKTNDICQICSACKEDVSDHLWKVRKMQRGMLENIMKRFMLEKKINLCTKV